MLQLLLSTQSGLACLRLYGIINPKPIQTHLNLTLKPPKKSRPEENQKFKLQSSDPKPKPHMLEPKPQCKPQTPEP